MCESTLLPVFGLARGLSCVLVIILNGKMYKNFYNEIQCSKGKSIAQQYEQSLYSGVTNTPNTKVNEFIETKNIL